MSRDCAYANHESENSKLEKAVIDCIPNMKEEIIELKYTIIRLSSNNQVVGEFVNLKQEINIVKTVNAEN